jgi:penicillin-binding protein 1A
MKKIKLSFFIFVLLGLLSIAVAMAGFVYYALQDLPNLDSLKKYEPPQSTLVYDRHGDMVGRFYDERRTVIKVNALPQSIKNAFIAAEDGDFYSHKGIDIFGLARAIAREIKYRLVGGVREGASTITQQTARTMFLTNQRTYVRKIKEIVLAKRIEQALSKDEILNLYLNQIYFGNGAYGIEEAAITYFGKRAKNLEVFEAAMLASIPKSPNRINPFGDVERLKQRQTYVLGQMVKRGFLTPSEEAAAIEAPMFSQVGSYTDDSAALYFLRNVKTELLPKIGDETIRRGGLKVYTSLDLALQKNAERALRQGLIDLDRRAGYRGPLFRPSAKQVKELTAGLEKFRQKAFTGTNKQKFWDLKNVYKKDQDIFAFESCKLVSFADGQQVAGLVSKVDDQKGLAVIDLGSTSVTMPFSAVAWAREFAADKTTPAPTKISQVLKVGDVISLKLSGLAKNPELSLWQDPLINGGLIALDVETGGVLAMVGGYDFNLSPFNRVTQAKRQVGSVIKPFIYSKAINEHLATPATIITDAPKAFFDPTTEEFWRPKNHTGKFLGDITLRRCLRGSINTCTITLLEKIGLPAFLNMAKDVELYTDATPYPANLTIALGSTENSPMQMANALRIFPNLGAYSPAHSITRVKYPQGGGYVADAPAEKTVIGPEAAFITSWIMKDVISHNQRARYLSNNQADLAGKTATTNAARTTMFFGFSQKILALVYVGYDDNRSMGETAWGRTMAFPIWADFMNRIPLHHEPLKFTEPPGLEWRMIDQNFGRAVLLAEGEEEAVGSVWEPFISGTAPSAEAAGEQVNNRGSSDSEGSAFAP